MKITTRVDSIDDVEFELLKEGKLKESSNNHNYVNNKELLEEFLKYKVVKDKLKNEFIQKTLVELELSSVDELNKKDSKLFKKAMTKFVPPKLSDKIGAAIIQVAYRRCNSRQYVGYSNNWKEELISNAIMTAAIRCHNFDPEKSSNPFAYVTQICDNAIKEQIKKEKKQLYVKYKSIEDTNGFYGQVDENNMDEHELQHQMESLPADQRRVYIDTYEGTHFPKKEKNCLQDTSVGGIMDFL
jgi:hypothetical protein